MRKALNQLGKSLFILLKDNIVNYIKFFQTLNFCLVQKRCITSPQRKSLPSKERGSKMLYASLFMQGVTLRKKLL